MSHPYHGIALTVGISKYENMDNLDSAVNDADEMAKKLREYQFDVIALSNPSIDQIKIGVEQLMSRLRINSYNVVVVFYAGHGVADFNSHFILGPEYTDDEHQLVINGLNIEKDIIDEICAISVPGHKKRSLLVILDTCQKKTERNLDQYQLSENQRKNEGSIGILVGYACGRGLDATDGHHGSYTQFILEEFFKPGVCVLDALSVVNIRVANVGSKSQKPQMVVDDVNCFKFCINEMPETLKVLKGDIAPLKSELMRESITIENRTEEDIKIKMVLEEQIYSRDIMRAEYNCRITALDSKIKFLQAENKKLISEKEKLEEVLDSVLIEHEKIQLEHSKRVKQVSDSEVMEKIYEITGGPLWTKNKDTVSWPLNSCTAEFREADGRITYINLSSNNLIGPIAPELGRLSGLTYLNLYDNGLQGAIPVEFGELKNLVHLYLFHNQLTGNIPKELGELLKLKELYLHTNQLTGAIPAELGKLKNLVHLYLSSNQLIGKIPKQLGELSGLKELDLRDNRLTGVIPVELGKLLKLEKLYLHNNQLAGAVPVELEKLKNLVHLYLSGNQLTGGPPMVLGCYIKFHPQRLLQDDGHFEANDQTGKVSEQSLV